MICFPSSLGYAVILFYPISGAAFGSACSTLSLCICFTMCFFAAGGNLPRIPTYFRNKEAFVFLVHNAALCDLVAF